MVFYIASMTYQNIIATAVRESEMLLYGTECSNNFLLKKYVNENYSLFSNTSLECFILDITSLEFIEEEVKDEHSPKVVRVKQFPIRPMSVEDAAVQMELLGHSFFVFVNVETERTNILYQRKDGGLGLLEPEA